MSVVIPNLEKAVIDQGKLTDYLLSEVHPVGRFKAVFFNALGFTAANWSAFRDALLDLTRQNPASLGQASLFGQKYVVQAELMGLNGRSAAVTIVWIVEPIDLIPRLVTVYPG